MFLGSPSIRYAKKNGMKCSLIFSLPVVGVMFLYGPLGIIQGIYAKYFGFSLTTIAIVFMIARLFDAVSDPLIGYLSDRYYQRNGSRKRFVLLGAILLFTSSYLLYVPADLNIFQASGIRRRRAPNT